jgi:hypothetical protein
VAPTTPNRHIRPAARRRPGQGKHPLPRRLPHKIQDPDRFAISQLSAAMRSRRSSSVGALLLLSDIHDVNGLNASRCPCPPRSCCAGSSPGCASRLVRRHLLKIVVLSALAEAASGASWPPRPRCSYGRRESETISLTESTRPARGYLVTDVHDRCAAAANATSPLADDMPPCRQTAHELLRAVLGEFLAWTPKDTLTRA